VQKEHPVGVKVVAGVLFIEAAILFTSAAAACVLSPQHASAYQFFLGRIPFLGKGPLAVDAWMMIVALVVGMWQLAKGLGIWFMKQWARMLIIIDLLCRFSGFPLAVALLNRKDIGALASNPDFVIGFLTNLLALVVLSESSTARAFEEKSP